MQPSILLSAWFAGFAYGILPGPACLAVFGIGADRGRLAGARFLGGHFFGDIVWYTLTLVSIIGVTSIGERVFQVLGVVSGLYLIYLGVQAIRHAGEAGAGLLSGERDPLHHGLAFGLTNPKAYPVAAAMFTALLASHAAELSWGVLPVLVVAAALGSIGAYVVLVYAVGLPVIRRFYRRYEAWISRICGLMFVAFGGKSIADSVRR